MYKVSLIKLVMMILPVVALFLVKLHPASQKEQMDLPYTLEDNVREQTLSDNEVKYMSSTKKSSAVQPHNDPQPNLALDRQVLTINFSREYSLVLGSDFPEFDSYEQAASYMTSLYYTPNIPLTFRLDSVQTAHQLDSSAVTLSLTRDIVAEIERLDEATYTDEIVLALHTTINSFNSDQLPLLAKFLKSEQSDIALAAMRIIIKYDASGSFYSELTNLMEKTTDETVFEELFMALSDKPYMFYM